jgi:acyl-CoA reductase-like NAD-dependent aldehyde dehydrogenase
MTQTVDALTNLSVRSQAFVDGAYVDAASGETFDCINPATGLAIESVAASRARFAPASSGSTASTAATSRRRSAASSSPVSVATSRSTRSTSAPT